ncbi:MAG: DUF3037 domain-containing protein [Marmoricola sp.]
MSSPPRAQLAYQYVVLRCVPRVDREEFVNVGLVLYCQQAGFLSCECAVDRGRVLALDPDLDLAALDQALGFVAAVCGADPAAGEVATRPRGVRFGFLTAPRSTVVQPGPVHGGITDDPAAEIERLLGRLVR